MTRDLVVTAFRAGATAEDIAQKFPPVPLADVHLIIAHYLRIMPPKSTRICRGNGLKQRRSDKASSNALNQTGLRDRLLAHRESQPARI